MGTAIVTYLIANVLHFLNRSVLNLNLPWRAHKLRAGKLRMYDLAEIIFNVLEVVLNIVSVLIVTSVVLLPDPLIEGHQVVLPAFLNV